MWNKLSQAAGFSSSSDTVEGEDQNTTEQQPDTENSLEKSKMEEMYAQMVYKDSKILELNNQILELERKMLDLQEHIREKDAVLQSRNLAVQLMSEDMSRKGKTVVDELEETRNQMKIMQSTFADAEAAWKQEVVDLKSDLTNNKEQFQKNISEKDSLIQTLEDSLKKIEAVRYELVINNADLQKKVVLAEENADKRCTNYRNQFETELENLKKEVKVKESDIQAFAEELTQLRSAKQHVEEITQLQQHIAVLEEEKGTLQLRLMDLDELLSVQEKSKAENLKLQHHLMEQEDKLCHVEKENTRLSEQNATLETSLRNREDELKTLQINYQETCQKRDFFAKSLEEITSADKILEDKLHILEEVTQNSDKHNKTLSEENAAIKDQKIALEMKIIELEEICEEKDQIRIELVDRLDALQGNSEEKNMLQSAYIDLEKKLKNSDENEIELKQQIKKLLEKMAAMENMNAAANFELATLNAEKPVLLQSIEVSNQKVSELEQSVTILTSELADKEENIKLLKINTQTLQKDLTVVFSKTEVQNLNEFLEKWTNSQQELISCKNNLNSISKEAETLKVEMASKEHENKAFIHEIETLKKKIYNDDLCFKDEKNELNVLLKKISDENLILKNLNQEKGECISKFQNENNEKEKRVFALNQHLEEMKNQLLLLENEKLLLNQEFCNLKQQEVIDSGKVQSKIESLLEQISDLESEVSQLANKISFKNRIITDLEQKITSLQLEIKNCIQNQSEKEIIYQNSCKEKDNFILTLEEQLTEMKNNLYEKVVELEQTHNHEHELENTISELRLSLENLCEEKHMLTKNYNDLDAKVSKLNEDLCFAEKKIETLETELDKQNNVVTKVENDKYLLKKTIEDLEIESKKQYEERLQIEDKLKSAMGEISFVREQLNATNIQISDLEEKISKLASSEKEMGEHEQSVVTYGSEVVSKNLNVSAHENEKCQSEDALEGMEHSLTTDLVTLYDLGGTEDSLTTDLVTVYNLDNETIDADVKTAADAESEPDALIMNTSTTTEIEKVKLALEEEIKKCNQKIEQLSNENQELGSNLKKHERLNSEFEYLQDTLNNTTVELKQCKQILEATTEERDSVANAMFNQQEEVKKIEENFKSLMVNIKEIHESFVSHKPDSSVCVDGTEILQQIQNQLSCYKDENCKLSLELQACQTRFQKLNSKYNEAELHQNELKQNIDILQKENAVCLCEFQSLVNQLINADKSFDEMFMNVFSHVENLDGKLRICELNLTKVKKYVAAIDIHQLQLDNEGFLKLNEDLKKSLVTIQSEKNMLLRSFTELRNQYAKYQQQTLSLLSNGCNDVVKKIDNSVKSMNSSTAQVDELHKEIETMNDILEEKKREISVLKLQLDAHQEKIHKDARTLPQYENCMPDISKNLEHVCLSITVLEKEITALNTANNLSVEKEGQLQAALLKLQHIKEDYKSVVENFKILKVKCEDVKNMCEILKTEHMKTNDISTDMETADVQLKDEIKIVDTASDNLMSEKESLCSKSSEKYEIQWADCMSKYDALKQLVLYVYDIITVISKNEYVGDIDISLQYDPCLQNSEFNDFVHLISVFVFDCANLKKCIQKERAIFQNVIQDIKSYIENLSPQDASLLQCLFDLQNFIKMAEIDVFHQGDKPSLDPLEYVSTCSTINNMHNRDKLQESKKATFLEKTALITELVEGKASAESDHVVESTCVKVVAKAEEQGLHIGQTETDLWDQLNQTKYLYDNLKSELENQILINEKLELDKNDLQKKLNDYAEEAKKFNHKWQVHVKESECKVTDLNLDIQKLKEHNFFSRTECSKVQAELKGCKQSLEDCNVSFVLQSEENGQLREKLKKYMNELEKAKELAKELQQKYELVVNENSGFQQEVYNLREHTDMLISDNSTYQEIVEKLRHTKIMLEQNLAKTKDEHIKEIQNVENRFLKEVLSLKQIVDQRNQKIIELQHSLDHFQSTEVERNSLSNEQLLEANEKRMYRLPPEKEKFQSSSASALLKKEKTNDSKRNVSVTTASVQTPIIDTSVAEPKDLIEKLQAEISSHLHKIEALETNINVLNDELQSSNTRYNSLMEKYIQSETMWKEEITKIETSYKQIISDLQSQISVISKKNHDSEGQIESKKDLEFELKQAMSSLHKQGLRCNELCLEVSKLLEEKDLLRSKVTQQQQQLQHLQNELLQFENRKSDILENLPVLSKNIQTTVDEVTGITDSNIRPQTVSSKSYSTELALIHQRLLEAEKTCQELRQVNETLDNALVIEKEQRKRIEEELGFSQNRFIPETTSTKDEYRLLLGDINEPEMLVEKNFSVTREVKSHAHKLRRWLRSKRINLSRTCQRKKYPEILYIFYICVIHIWLLICTFGHR